MQMLGGRDGQGKAPQRQKQQQQQKQQGGFPDMDDDIPFDRLRHELAY
ncbi:MAG: hypothetical protein HN661_09410 [Gammaproteobacteria bacterium]|nr:hypothetical protein [Gammaproteobacteria bacterium]